MVCFFEYTNHLPKQLVDEVINVFDTSNYSDI